MPKRLLPVLLLLLSLVLAGCGDDGDGGDGGDDTAQDPAAGGTSASVGAAPQGSEPPPDVDCEYTPDEQIPAAKEVDPPSPEPVVGGELRATLDTTLGAFQVTLDAASAPCTVNSFVSLTQQGYYDDSPCHRLTTLEEGGIAVLQCGDPTGTGTGGPGYTYGDELSGTESYGPGTLAMANRGPDTNGSQFFVVYDETPLPPSYTVFGSVDQAGIDAITELAAQGTVPGEGGMTAPSEDVLINSVAFGG
jgi:peptidyl-prolyl cis-trans isomerase B (cyclophilin B)